MRNGAQPSSGADLTSVYTATVINCAHLCAIARGSRTCAGPVGVNATIKRLIPVWKFGKPEPFKIYFDCGLGRTFDKTELLPLLRQRK